MPDKITPPTERPAADSDIALAELSQSLQDSPPELLHTADGDIGRINHEMADLRAQASNPSNPLEKRLEAFDDIIDSEVGDTPLIRARNLERDLGFRQLYLKFEGGSDHF